MRRLAGALTLTAAIAGCTPSTVSYIMDNYNTTPVTYQQTADVSYRIFDRPADSRMMITGSLGAGMRQDPLLGGVVEPAENYSAAAIEWLKTQGRECTAVSATLLAEPQYEVVYACK